MGLLDVGELKDNATFIKELKLFGGVTFTHCPICIFYPNNSSYIFTSKCIYMPLKSDPNRSSCW